MLRSDRVENAAANAKIPRRNGPLLYGQTLCDDSGILWSFSGLTLYFGPGLSRSGAR
jgi:hypothetical protein